MKKSSKRDDTDSDELRRHLAQVARPSGSIDTEAQLYSLSTTPLFSRRVKQHVAECLPQQSHPFSMYGLLGLRTATYDKNLAPTQITPSLLDDDDDDAKSSQIHRSSTEESHSERQGGNLIYSNTSAPWSAFICGQQGAGKSYTFSCLLENALLSGNHLGRNNAPLSGLVFHYDKHSAAYATQVCEAAFLCCHGVKIEVLVSPTNITAMTRAYKIPNLPKDKQPKVKPLLFNESQIKLDYMLTLTNQGSAEKMPLYMATVVEIIREMKTSNQAFSMTAFDNRIKQAKMNKDQKNMLDQRKALLKTFMFSSAKPYVQQMAGNAGISTQAGHLTIVDLSCSTISESDVCTFYEICLSMFLAARNDAHGLIVGIDEAHKFLTDTPEAVRFTTELIRLIRQQRHLKSRVVIATQEPTLSPQLMDLCDVSIVHRFRSPAWFGAIRGHLAGLTYVGDVDTSNAGKEVFERIVGLGDGEALLFASSAVLDVEDEDGSHGQKKGGSEKIDDSSSSSDSSSEDSSGGTLIDGTSDGDTAASVQEMRLDGKRRKSKPVPVKSGAAKNGIKELAKLQPLNLRYIKMQIRQRLTQDGGKSQMAG